VSAGKRVRAGSTRPAHGLSSSTLRSSARAPAMRRPTQLRRAALGGDCGARRLQARARSPRGATVGRATGTLHGCTPSMSDATTAAASSTVRETPIAASNQTTNSTTDGDEAGADGREDMAGINYSKWDSLEVSDSEDEEDAASRAVLAQEHREMEEAAASQRKLRELITEHESGKPLEPPEEVRDILEEPLWCDEPGSVGVPADVAHQRAGAGADQAAASARQDGGGAGAPQTGAPGAGRSSAGGVPPARAAGKRRDFADWDKLTLDDSDGEADVVAETPPRPPAEVEKMRQLMQLQEGLSKMRKDRELRQQQIREREQRILERDGVQQDA